MLEWYKDIICPECNNLLDVDYYGPMFLGITKDELEVKCPHCSYKFILHNKKMSCDFAISGMPGEIIPERGWGIKPSDIPPSMYYYDDGPSLRERIWQFFKEKIRTWLAGH